MVPESAAPPRGVSIFSVAPEGVSVQKKLNHADTCAVILIVVGFAEIVLGAIVRDIISSSVGGWWAGMLCVMTGIVSLSNISNMPSLCESGVLVVWMHFLSGVSIFVTLVSLTIDGTSLQIVNELDVCVSDEGLFGNSDDNSLVAENAEFCHNSDFALDCNCVGEYVSSCYSYYMTHDSGDCSPIFEELPSALDSSVTCLWFLFLIVISNSMIMCRYRGCCCRSSESEYAVHGATVAPAAPTAALPNAQIQMGIPAPQGAATVSIGQSGNTDSQQLVTSSTGYVPVVQDGFPGPSSSQAVPIQTIPVAKSINGFG